MSNVTYIQEGSAIDHTPGLAVSAGDVVVQGELVGVAKLDIPANTLGALAVTGVFDFPKASGVAVTFATGDVVYWDDTNDLAVATAAAGANKQIGKAVLAAADADASVRVRMSQ